MRRVDAFCMRILAAAVATVLLAVSPPTAAGAHGEGHAAAAPGAAPRAASSFDRDAALAYSQAAVGRTVADAVFTDTRGRPVRLADYRGKPLVVSLIYTSCVHTCPIITNTLADAAEVARDALGRDSFNVVTIGFDVRHDTPDRMRLYAVKHGLARIPGWAFLSADAATIDRLARDLGFIYFPSSKGFDHLAQTTVLDADGKVYRQVYGESVETTHLGEPLKELVFGTTAPFSSIADLVKKVRLFCTIYDPAADRYRFDYSLFIRMGVGFLVIVGVAVFLVRELLRARRRRAGPGRTPA